MDIGDWEPTKGLNELYREIRRLGLESNVAELDNFGYTIVPPERVAPPEFTERLLARILELVERRSGVKPDLETGSTHAEQPVGIGEEHYLTLFEDRVFEEALMNPTSLALATYLLGESCALSVDTILIKGPRQQAPLPIHCDNVGIPSPFPPYAQICNTTWVLTDYSLDNGATCFIPGSHRWCRHPTPVESFEYGNAVPVEAPKGSLLVWGGNTWHGAFARNAPGLRVNLLFGYGRSYIRPFQPYKETVPKEILERNPPRFAKLLGQEIFQGFGKEGPDLAKVILLPRGLYD